MVGPSMISSYKYNFTLKSSNIPTTIKFLCSYGGKILPRYPDSKLRYHGGETRVLAVDRSISYSELVAKLGEMCGSSVSLRCQLPTEDMDALISITSDEDLGNLIEEYDRASTATTSALKIRAILSAPKSANKKLSPTPSTASSSSTSNDATTSPNSSVYSTARRPPKSPANNHRCIHQNQILSSKPAIGYPCPLIAYEKAAAKALPHHQYGYYGPGNTSSNHIYLIHHGNHWQ